MIIYCIKPVIAMAVLLVGQLPVEADKVFPCTPSSSRSIAIGALADAEVRILILESLSRPDRDEVLTNLVPYYTIADEKWFDLRGLHVNAGEMVGSANVSRLCLDGARFAPGVDISGIDFSFVLLRGAVFDGVQLRRSSFQNAHIVRADFLGCDLTDANCRVLHAGPGTAFRGCVLNGARFDNSPDLCGVSFNGRTAVGAVFNNAELTGAVFTRIDLSNASFVGAELSRVDFFGSQLGNVDLKNARLSGARLSQVFAAGLKLNRANLTGAYLGDLGVEANEWRGVTWDGEQPLVGEEVEADRLQLESDANSFAESMRLYAQALRIYKALARNHQDANEYDEYRRCAYRAAEARRKLLVTKPGRLTTAELIWLSLSKYVDGYGTRPLVLVRAWLVVMTFYMGIYMLLFSLKWDDQSAWYKTTIDGSCIRETDSYHPSQEDTVLARINVGSCSTLKRVTRCCAHAVWLSVDSTFMFAEKAIGIPSFAQLFRTGEERLVAKGVTRVIVGTQALSGAFLLAMGARMFLRVTGS